MRPFRIRIGLISLLLAVIVPLAALPTQTAHACSCAALGERTWSLRDLLTWPAPTLVGTVQAAIPVQVQAPSDFRPRLVEMHRVQVLMDETGLGANSPVAEVWTAARSESCGYTFRVGTRYRIVTHWDRWNLSTSACSRNEVLPATTSLSTPSAEAGGTLLRDAVLVGLVAAGAAGVTGVFVWRRRQRDASR